jgi:hypothetical protein
MENLLLAVPGSGAFELLDLGQIATVGNLEGINGYGLLFWGAFLFGGKGAE